MKTGVANYLGIECGGTRTVVLFGPGGGGPCRRAEFGPANLRLLDDARLVKHFKAISRAVAALPAAVVIGMAGARTEKDRRRIREAAAKVWPGVPVHAANDLETALAAAPGPDGPDSIAKVLILSGTGSCCFGRRNGANGARTVRLGGWGHILGDRGSGYEIGLRALRTVLAEMDHQGQWPALGAGLLRTLQLNEADDLIDWAREAEKEEIAALAPEVFAAAAKRDRLARKILAEAAWSLAMDGASCARQLAGRGAPVEFVLAGGILLNQPGFARQVRAGLRQLRPGARVTTLARESVWGTMALAETHFTFLGSPPNPAHEPFPHPGPLPSHRMGGEREKRAETNDSIAAGRAAADLEETGAKMVSVSGTLPPTEQRNPRSRNLDRMPLAKAVALMIREESLANTAVFKERRKIARAVEIIARSLRRGGRLIYAGAGTSGRLGVLDASECPPTFRLPPDRVQGIIAGGRAALWKSVEGAEDDAAAGAAAIICRGVNKNDVVIGIAASGRTPFVWGALEAAAKRGARTLLLCCNPRLEIPAARRPTLVIAPDTGPEVLTGSTRLKAGTATKLILNMLSTLAMVRLGKVRSNLMVDLNASNEKLRDRAVRIVQSLTGAPPAAARAALEKASWIVPRACQKLK
jgi:N-acetylmuramic acid 6-phosphate etherase